MELSIVIPAYNEVGRIEDTLSGIFRLLDSRKMSFEVIVVDDGSSDGTAEKIESMGLGERLRVRRLDANRGKGAAVRAGMFEAKGNYILMSDADLATPIEEIDKLLPQVKADYDIAAGSRQLPGSDIMKRQRFYRQTIGLAFGSITRLVIKTGVIDTQCGFKCFRAAAAKKLFSVSRINGYCFDVEVLALARAWGMRVIEVPVRWENKAGSKVSVIRDLPGVIWETLLIRLNLSRGVYDQCGTAPDS